MNHLEYPFKNDHEVVIALIEDFNNQIEEFNRQQLESGKELLEIKRILIRQNEQVEGRLSRIEEDLKDIDVQQLAKTVEEHENFIRKFNNTKHAVLTFGAFFFTVMGYLLNLTLTYLNHALK